MCLVILIGADEPIAAQRIPVSEGLVEVGIVEIIEEHDEHYLGLLGTRHYVWVASEEGCACAFHGGKYEESDDRLERVQALLGILRGLNSQSRLRLLLCWDGDERLPVEHIGVANEEMILKPDFFDDISAPRIYDWQTAA